MSSYLQIIAYYVVLLLLHDVRTIRVSVMLPLSDFNSTVFKVCLKRAKKTKQNEYTENTTMLP